jgi:predicted N-acetyltransferase YhbS
MTLRIRSEVVLDYHKIAEINAMAFAPSLKEPLTSSFVSEFALVDLLRHGVGFDQDLSLVAELDGAIVGHALFYPHRVFVGGNEMLAVSLGPIAVEPAFQRKGIGGQLILEGHGRARDKGYAYSFLLGHPTYYPRFGYLQNMFGECHIKVRVNDIPVATRGLAERLVHRDDLGWLHSTWLDWFEDVDLAIFPGPSVLDWLSHAEQIMAVVVEKDGEAIGYVRYVKHDPAQVRLFLARDRTAIRPLLAHLRARLRNEHSGPIKLPLHPASEAVRTRFDLPFQPQMKAWGPAMIKILDESNSTIGEYCKQVNSGQGHLGLVVWPPCIEFA